MKLCIVAGARPNFMKVAPIIRAIRYRSDLQINYRLVHTTGQHYGYEMTQAFFKDLEIPKTDIFMEAGYGSYAEQTVKIMVKFEKVCKHDLPDVVLLET